MASQPGGTVLRFKRKDPLAGSAAISKVLQEIVPRTTTTAAAAAAAGPEESARPLASRSAICMPSKADYTEEAQKISREKLRQEINLSQHSIDTLPELFAESVTIMTMSEKDILKRSVVKVLKPLTTIEHTSINDPAMGATEYGQVCSTCRRDSLSCIGHYGHIELNVPIINPLAMRTLIRVLKVVCNSDGKLLVPVAVLKRKGVLSIQGMKRLERIEALVDTGFECIPEEGCKTRCNKNPVFDLTKSEEINEVVYTTSKSKSKRDTDGIFSYSIDMVQMILDNISDETYELLGFINGATARNFILKVLPVIPPTVRLQSEMDGKIWENDITRAYVDIVKVNNQLAALDIPEVDKERLVRQLSDNVKKLFDTIRKRTQGKRAIFRENLMGKRVNYAGRTVISPDPSLKFGQVRVSMRLAQIITKRVRIYEKNHRAMTIMLRSGCVTHIKKPNGNTHVVSEEMRKTYTLQIGDICYRWLQSGDVIITNRQPSLSKKSWLGFEVVIVGVKYKRNKDGLIEITDYGPHTTGLMLPYTTPFNADFDGDEMNLHVPQNEKAEAEARYLLNVEQCIMSDQTNQPAMGLVMNAVTAVSILTKDGVYVSQETLFDCMTLLTTTFDIDDWRARCAKYKVAPSSGKALISITFPKDFFYERGKVKIMGGILVHGPLSKAHVGPTSGSIVQAIWHDYGAKRASDFITDANFVLDLWFKRRGFSLSLQDCNPQSKQQKELVDKEIESARLAVQTMGAYLADPIEDQRREQQLIVAINNVNNVGGKIIKDSLAPSNPLRQMIESGAKGKGSNAAQMTALIGQQFLGGARLKAGLPFFDPDDDEVKLESRGFIRESFVSGMTPASLFFHQASGREGIVNTGLTTADSGTIHRSLVKYLENVVAMSDGTVRDTSNVVYSFAYGGDISNPERLIKSKLKGQDVLLPINIFDTAARLNAKYGY